MKLVKNENNKSEEEISDKEAQEAFIKIWRKQITFFYFSDIFSFFKHIYGLFNILDHILHILKILIYLYKAVYEIS